MLADGRYDAIVFDADDTGGNIVVELAIVSGDHKGEVISLRTSSWRGDPIDLLGVPATVTVEGGEPVAVFER